MYTFRSEALSDVRRMSGTGQKFRTDYTTIYESGSKQIIGRLHFQGLGLGLHCHLSSSSCPHWDSLDLLELISSVIGPFDAVAERRVLVCLAPCPRLPSMTSDFGFCNRKRCIWLQINTNEKIKIMSIVWEPGLARPEPLRSISARITSRAATIGRKMWWQPYDQNQD